MAKKVAAKKTGAGKSVAKESATRAGGAGRGSAKGDARGAAKHAGHRSHRSPALHRVDTLPTLPPRDPAGHKATFGHVLVLAGSMRYTGAPVLAARAVLRSGAGLATVGCPKSAHPLIAGHLLCEMAFALPDASPGVFSGEAVSEALDRTERVHAVALGPGITTSAPALEFAQQMAILCPLPLVLDADGLNAFAGSAQRLESAEGPRVLTPHPGEAARLLGCTADEVVRDREGIAIRLARETENVVLLKGAGTIVTDAQRVYVNCTGNSGMASAGAGDVLTGVIAALMAQGFPAFEAAVLGAYLHGRAGDIAAERLGEHGLIATDILDALPLAFREHAARSAVRDR